MAASYQYKATYFGPRRVPASVVVAEAAKLDEQGGVTPEGLVALASSAMSPLHPAFTWDDTEAGHQYRLIEARRLLRAVVCVPECEEAEPVRVYVHVPAASEEGRGFYRTAENLAVNRPDEYQRALTELQRRVEAAHASFNELRRLGSAQPAQADLFNQAASGFEAVQSALTGLRYLTD